MRKSLFVPAFLSAALVATPIRAELITTDEAQMQRERDRITAILERPEAAQQLELLGIAPDEAKARVGAMTDPEVHQLAKQIDALPAGGQLTVQNLLLIVIIILLVIALL